MDNGANDNPLLKNIHTKLNESKASQKALGERLT